jgi:hypothetical protein
LPTWLCVCVLLWVCAALMQQQASRAKARGRLGAAVEERMSARHSLETQPQCGSLPFPSLRAPASCALVCCALLCSLPSALCVLLSAFCSVLCTLCSMLRCASHPSAAAAAACASCTVRYHLARTPKRHRRHWTTPRARVRQHACHPHVSFTAASRQHHVSFTSYVTDGCVALGC